MESTSKYLRMKKANLFIVGAAKGGTTSLYHYLNQHPEIHMCPIKEPNFFGSDIQWDNFRDDYKKSTYLNIDEYLQKERLEQRHNAFINSLNDYELLFRDALNEKYLGEASPSYLYSKNAAEEIFNYNPKAKIIIILRQPVSRTLSHYLMDLSSGIQKEKNILKGLKADLENDKKGWGVSNLYIELSLYYEQVTRYLEIFPREQILILEYTRLKMEFNLLIREIFNFLNLNYIDIDFNKNKIHNKTLIPKNRIIHYLVKFKKLIPSRINVPNEVEKFIYDLVLRDWEKTKKILELQEEYSNIR